MWPWCHEEAQLLLCFRINGTWIRRVALPEDEEFQGFGPYPVPGQHGTITAHGARLIHLPDFLCLHSWVSNSQHFKNACAFKFCRDSGNS